MIIITYKYSKFVKFQNSKGKVVILLDYKFLHDYYIIIKN